MATVITGVTLSLCAFSPIQCQNQEILTGYRSPKMGTVPGNRGRLVTLPWRILTSPVKPIKLPSWAFSMGREDTVEYIQRNMHLNWVKPDFLEKVKVLTKYVLLCNIQFFIFISNCQRPEYCVLCLTTDQVNPWAMVVYLAESFPCVSVNFAQAHHHVHTKTPHHVVLQIPERRRNMVKKAFLLTQSHGVSVMGDQLFLIHAMRSDLHTHRLSHAYRLI